MNRPYLSKNLLWGEVLFVLRIIVALFAGDAGTFLYFCNGGCIVAGGICDVVKVDIKISYRHNAGEEICAEVGMVRVIGVINNKLGIFFGADKERVCAGGNQRNIKGLGQLGVVFLW